MKTKVLSIFIAFFVMASMITTNIYANDTDSLLAEYDENNEFLKAVGIYDAEFNEIGTAVLSRGEFIHYAFQLLNYQPQPVEVSPFWDLKPDYEHYNSVANAYMCGILNGYGDGSVGVYKTITVQDAIGILVRILGYDGFVDVAYSYPDGVHKIANRLKLIDGLSFENELTYSGMSALLKCVLRTPVMEQTVYGDREAYDNSEDVTLLSQNFDIYYVEGIVKADQISSLNIDIKENNGKIQIQDTIINMDYSGTRYLGYNVECWYKKTSKVNDLVYINPINNNVTTIRDKEIDTVSDASINYYVNNKEKRVRFGNTTVYLYNGKKIDYTTEFSEELFKINEGNVVTVDNNSDNVADVVYINNYYNFVVKSYSATDKVLLGYDDKFLDFEDDELVYNMKDIYKKNIDISSLKQYDVLSVLKSNDEKYIDITVSYNRVTSQLEEIGNDSSYDTILLKGETYQVSPDYYAENDLSYYLGKPAVFCINMFGRVSAIYNEKAFGTDKFALVVDAIPGEGGRASEDSKIRILDNSDNNPEFLKLNIRVKLDGKLLDADVVVKELWKKGISQDNLIGVFIRYNQNEEGLVTLIDTPEKGTTEEELSLNIAWTPDDGTLNYKSYGYFAVNYYRNSKTKFFGVPSKTSVEAGDLECECYDDLQNDYKSQPYIYTLGKNTAIMCGVIVEKLNVDITTNEVDEKSDLFVVDNITATLNSDGDEIKLLKLISEVGNVEIPVEEKQLPLIKDLSRGDVIRYSMSLSGKLTALQKIYDYSDKKPVLDNNATNGHNQIRVGIVCDVLDGLYVKTALINKGDIKNTNFDLLARSKFVNISIDKSHVFKLDRENITFEPADVTNIKTYEVYNTEASVVISVMQYNQTIDMLILSE